LTAEDARIVENAFEQRVAGLGGTAEPDETPAPATEAVGHIDSGALATGTRVDVAEGPKSAAIDKSVLAIAEPRRYRNKAHLRFVASKACLVCGRKPSDPHHLRFTQPRALGRKVSDEFAVPLCRIHHRLVHRVGNEAAWWQEAGIDALKAARTLWNHTRLNGDQSTSKDASQSAVLDRASEHKNVERPPPA
jgi:hypothetical protein